MTDYFKDEIKPPSCIVKKAEDKVLDYATIDTPDQGLPANSLLYNPRTDDLRRSKSACIGENQMVLLDTDFGGKESRPYLEGDKLFVLMELITEDKDGTGELN